MSTANVSLQIIPLTQECKVYPIIDKVIEHIKAKGIKHEVGPMETTMEGELDDLLKIVKEAQIICEKMGAKRVVSVVKIDYKPEGVTINEKVKNYR